MRRYRLSPKAAADVDAIWDYTADTWGVEQANRYTRDIRAACTAVAQGERIGRKSDDIRTGYQRLGVGSHFIFYVVREDIVDVIRVLHQRMDFARRLGE